MKSDDHQVSLRFFLGAWAVLLLAFAIVVYVGFRLAIWMVGVIS